MKWAAHGQSVEEQSASDFCTVTVDELSSLFSALSATGSKSV